MVKATSLLTWIEYQFEPVIYGMVEKEKHPVHAWVQI